MKLGAFSVSLTVKDMTASRDFYEKLGFAMIGGDGENWTIVNNEATTIGLFCGMFDSNILTFNPGWDGPGEDSESFTDIRDLSASLSASGLSPGDDTTSDSESGPASFTLSDPDGNLILIDQHV